MRANAFLLHNRSSRLLLKGLFQELMSVEARAFDCKEQFTGVQGSRVDRITPNFQVAGPVERSANCFANFFQ